MFSGSAKYEKKRAQDAYPRGTEEYVLPERLHSIVG